jgi:hypothetical protein
MKWTTMLASAERMILHYKHDAFGERPCRPPKELPMVVGCRWSYFGCEWE